MPGAQNDQRREKKSKCWRMSVPSWGDEQAPPSLHVGSGWDRGPMSDKKLQRPLQQ